MVFYVQSLPALVSNAIVLLGAFQVVCLGRSADQAAAPFSYLRLRPFRDAGLGPSLYDCTLLHCLKGLETAMRLKWYDFNTFDICFYEKHDRLDQGDFHWVIPGKLLAFSSPNDSKRWNAEQYALKFRELGVTAVVRLNEPTYNSNTFYRWGIRHHDLFYPDGTCPSPSIVREFLSICAREKAVAVHCKAGLGRTGTLIGCYAIQQFAFPADEFIGWIRLCRPGSVLGPQQPFLVNYQAGASSFNSEIDNGQGERLMMAKSNRNSGSTPRGLYFNDRSNNNLGSVYNTMYRGYR